MKKIKKFWEEIEIEKCILKAKICKHDFILIKECGEMKFGELQKFQVGCCLCGLTKEVRKVFN